jgi:hypothetical protein
MATQVEDKEQSVSAEITKATLQQLPDRTTNTKGCLLTGKKAYDARGSYKKARLRDGSRNEFYLHRLAIIADGRGPQLVHAKRGGTHEVSHLCHEHGCFNASHLVVEKAEINKRRNGCVALLCAENGCPCGRILTNCKCIPPCILIPHHV